MMVSYDVFVNKQIKLLINRAKQSKSQAVSPYSLKVVIKYLILEEGKENLFII